MLRMTIVNILVSHMLDLELRTTCAPWGGGGGGVKMEDCWDRECYDATSPGWWMKDNKQKL